MKRILFSATVAAMLATGCAKDDAVVGEGALVAAGSVVLSRTVIGPHEMWAGAPAKFVKKVDPEKAQELNIRIAHNYLMYSQWYK